MSRRSFLGVIVRGRRGCSPHWSRRVRPEPAIGPARGRTRWAGPMVNSAKPTAGYAAGNPDGFRYRSTHPTDRTVRPGVGANPLLPNTFRSTLLVVQASSHSANPLAAQGS